jgi:hypothetical protein
MDSSIGRELHTYKWWERILMPADLAQDIRSIRLHHKATELNGPNDNIVRVLKPREVEEAHFDPNIINVGSTVVRESLIGRPPISVRVIPPEIPVVEPKELAS